MDRQDIYEKLLTKWEYTGKIGPVFCNTRNQAERVAYMASLSIINKQYKPIKQTIKPVMELKQLQLF